MQSNHRNEIRRDIEKGKGEGRYKDCFQLVLGDAGFWVGRVNSLLPQADTTVPPVIVEVDPGVGGGVQGM